MFDLVNSPMLRSLAWRIGRKLYCWARREVPNASETNGEYWLLSEVISWTSQDKLLMLDIGANRGDWSAQASQELDNYHKSGSIYAFEPTQSTHAFLSKRFRSDDRIHISNAALSADSGVAEFFVVREMAGTNSLHNGGFEDVVTEKVKKETLDHFLVEAGMGEVLFVKSDTEGHDMSVLRGAEKALRAGSIEVWQFEYNHRWVANHSLLKDVFDFIKDKPYCLGKLFGNGVEIFEDWHPELERFFEGNYVLVRNGSPIANLCIPMCFNASNVLVPVR